MSEKKSGALHDAEAALRTHGLRFQNVTEDFPWGHRALKIKGKAFVFMGVEDGRFFFTVKLPSSHGGALMLPFAKPTGYGLGKSGWISSEFHDGETIPVGLLKEWLDESFRAVAPKLVVRALDAGDAMTTSAKTTSAKKTSTSAKKTNAKKTSTSAKKTSAKKTSTSAKKTSAKKRSKQSK